MHISRLLPSAVFLATTVHGFFRMECQGRVGIARMDPMMSPGRPAEHVHSFHGSNGK